MTTLALIEQVTRWWDTQTFAQQFFFGIGIVAGVLALVLMILSIIGLDHHDVDASGVSDGGDPNDGAGIFSVKPLTGFFIGFGWIGGFALEQGWSLVGALLAATASGSLIMAVILLMLRAIFGMRSDGTVKISDSVGAIGTVYISLPAARASGGQVTVSFGGRQETYAALNASAASVASGEKVRVVAVVDNRTVLVEPFV